METRYKFAPGILRPRRGKEDSLKKRYAKSVQHQNSGPKMVYVLTASFVTTILTLSNPVQAVISYTTAGFTYTENFNSLANTTGTFTFTNNSTISGFYGY